MTDYLKRVLRLSKPYRFRLALGLLCGFLSGALASTLPLSLKLAVDTVFPEEQPVATAAAAAPAAGGASATAPAAGDTSAAAQAPAKTSQKNQFLPPAVQKVLNSLGNFFHPPGAPSMRLKLLAIALIPGAMFIRGVLAYLNNYMLFWVGIRVANDLRVRLFTHLMNLPLGFFSRNGTGELMARMEGTMAVSTTINSSFAIIIREPITIITLVGTLVVLQPLLSLFTLMVFPLCLIPIVIYGRKLRRSHSGIHTQRAGVAKVMHESFTGIRVVKAYNLETLVVDQYERAIQGLTSFYMRLVRASELPGPLIEFFGALGVACIFAYYASLPRGHAPVGNLLMFFIVVFQLYAPVKNLSRLHSQLTQARAGVEPACEILAFKNNLPEPAHPKRLCAREAAIRFENISFSYGEKPILHDINLTIQPGQLVALVGRTGSGKTSLTNLLLRFYDPQKGAILIGDTDIREISSRDLRANIAVVTQETILFNDTIRNNIALGRSGASQEEIVAAAKHAFAHDFIMDKPQHYDSPAGEKGVNVSGGQRQRLAIARAILKDAPILILDEATNALDAEAERIVQEALEKLMQGRTTICIAHRLSTIQNADLIVVLDHGRIVETGTHTELLKSDGIYRKLYELSFEPVAASAPAA